METHPVAVRIPAAVLPEEEGRADPALEGEATNHGAWGRPSCRAMAPNKGEAAALVGAAARAAELATMVGCMTFEAPSGEREKTCLAQSTGASLKSTARSAVHVSDGRTSMTSTQCTFAGARASP